MRIHETIHGSYANGPGYRYVIFFQGCLYQCEGCINPQTHSITAGIEVSCDKIISEIKNNKSIYEGVTFTGGEPLLQLEALLYLAFEIKKIGLTTILSTGANLNEIKEINREYPNFFKLFDGIIAGRFHHEEIIESGFIGSKNKVILTPIFYYSKEEIIGNTRAEFSINNSTIKATGTGIYKVFDWNSF